MRFAFIQFGWFEAPGTMCLAGVLRQAGHDVDCFIDLAEPDLVDTVLAWQPDLLGFSITPGEWAWAYETVRKVKARRTIPVVFGGTHPTFFPEILEQKEIDYICVGEGEDALLELVAALSTGRSPNDIPGIWTRASDSGPASRIPPRPLIRDFDRYPLPARDLYHRYPNVYHGSHKHIVACRGCPFDCAYCYNHLYFPLYGRNLVRRPSHERVLGEIELIRQAGSVEVLEFADDTFTADPAWLLPFLEAYRTRVGLPFICSVHAKCLSDEMCAALVRAGCYRVCIGIESGSERVRNQILGKNLSNEDLLKAAAMLHRHGLKILGNNMMGIPTETVDEAWQTVAFNARLRVEFPWCSLLQPYPKTRIADFCRKNGLLPEGPASFSPTLFQQSIIRQANLPHLTRIQKLFWFGVRLPRLTPLWKLLAKLPLDPLLHLMFLVSFAWRYMISNRLSLPAMIRFTWRNRNLYLGATAKAAKP
jgi:anaerobic magnesium-protoporphyrin IX monomethyl ester cyclase